MFAKVSKTLQVLGILQMADLDVHGSGSLVGGRVRDEKSFHAIGKHDQTVTMQQQQTGKHKSRVSLRGFLRAEEKGSPVLPVIIGALLDVVGELGVSWETTLCWHELVAVEQVVQRLSRRGDEGRRSIWAVGG